MPAGPSPLERISAKVGAPPPTSATERIVDSLAHVGEAEERRHATCAGELTQNPQLEVLDMSGDQTSARRRAACADIRDGARRGAMAADARASTTCATASRRRAEAVAAHKGLEWLSIRASAIKGATCESIADAIAHSVSLRPRRRRSNALAGRWAAPRSPTAWRAPARRRSSAAQLWRGVDPAERRAEVAEALADDGVARLKSLILRENFVGTEGALHFASMLKCNTELRELTLCDNNIDKEGVAAIAEAMEANSTLQYPNIRLNDFNVRDRSSGCCGRPGAR